MRGHDVSAVFAQIVAYKRAHDGNSPTLRELMEHCGVSSSSVMFHILRRLEDRGFIRFDNDDGEIRARGIIVTGGKWEWKE